MVSLTLPVCVILATVALAVYGLRQFLENTSHGTRTERAPDQQELVDDVIRQWREAGYRRGSFRSPTHWDGSFARLDCPVRTGRVVFYAVRQPGRAFNVQPAPVEMPVLEIKPAPVPVIQLQRQPEQPRIAPRREVPLLAEYSDLPALPDARRVPAPARARKAWK
jgi:hypothetical protein